MWLYWFKLYLNPTHADIVGGSIVNHAKEVYCVQYDYDIYQTKNGKYGLRFKNNSP